MERYISDIRNLKPTDELKLNDEKTEFMLNDWYKTATFQS